MFLTRRELLKAKNGAILQFSGEDNEAGGVSFNNNLALSSSSPVTMSMKETFNIQGADAYFSNNLNISGSVEVASNATVTNTLTVTQGTTLNSSLDVSGESIFESDTTISGSLKAESGINLASNGGSIQAGGNNALTIDSSGEVTKIGQTLPNNNEFLKWDGSKVTWDVPVASSISLDNVTGATSDVDLTTSNGSISISSTDDIFIESSDNTNLDIFYINNAVTGSHFNVSPTVSTLLFSPGDTSHGWLRGKSTNIQYTGYPGISLISPTTNIDHRSVVLGTYNNAYLTDRNGLSNNSSLIMQSSSNKFYYVDTSKATVGSQYAFPFYMIKKVKSIDDDFTDNYTVKFITMNNPTIVSNYAANNNYTENTFLEVNDDGEVIKLGHDTPTDGQVLTWNNADSNIVWEDLPASNETYSSQNSNFNASVGYYYSVDTTTTNVEITLPEISANNVGQRIIIKFKTGNNILQATPSANQTIEENNNFIFSPGQLPGQSITLISGPPVARVEPKVG